MITKKKDSKEDDTKENDNKDNENENKEKSEKEKNENKENEKEHKENIETEIDNSLEEKEINVDKYDISQYDENSFIYKEIYNPVILEDKTLKDKNKVKSTVYRLILVNRDSDEKNFKANVDYETKDDLLKLNSYVPSVVHDVVPANSDVTFYNIVRIKGDLPFLKRDDINLEINTEYDI